MPPEPRKPDIEQTQGMSLDEIRAELRAKPQRVRNQNPVSQTNTVQIIALVFMALVAIASMAALLIVRVV